jgi:ATP-dependent DNA helicase RecG
MKDDDKRKVMEAFAKGETDILVSTTVVEVGVNVPNATVMMIENAERFGLSQLHQLRGRVGRGSEQSYCIFVAGGSGEKSKKTLERLEIMSKTNDGFKIAEEDLKQRGPGDLFGLRQSGMPFFRMADIYEDSELIKRCSNIVKRLFEDSPEFMAKMADLCGLHIAGTGL